MNKLLENACRKIIRSRYLRWCAGAAALILIVFGISWRGSSTGAAYRTVPIERGSLVSSITATGTVEPEEVIDVGAQVAGIITSFGVDSSGKPIDYGSEVEEGTVLARIDDSLYLSDVQRAEAELKQAEADVLQLRAKLKQSEQDWKRAQKLGPSDALSQSAYDSYQAAFDAAHAALAVGEARVAQAVSALDKAKRNLGYCTIKSPVRGVIIDKRVNVGQTVVSSLNAPSLFLIAKDLRKMEVWVSVNEADIGSVQKGQRVIFTVDAFPGEEFIGRVEKVRLNASMTQNVVTYIVEVAADNSSGRLLPYLTANARFEVDRKDDVFLVPNSALRWAPAGEAGEAAAEDVSGGHERTGVIWVLERGAARPLQVGIGASDGTRTEVSGEKVAEGMPVIVGTKSERSAPGTTNNPFAPQIRRGSKRG